MPVTATFVRMLNDRELGEHYVNPDTRFWVLDGNIGPEEDDDFTGLFMATSFSESIGVTVAIPVDNLETGEPAWKPGGDYFGPIASVHGQDHEAVLRAVHIEPVTTDVEDATTDTVDDETPDWNPCGE